jgi:hypothetical protein
MCRLAPEPGGTAWRPTTSSRRAADEHELRGFDIPPLPQPPGPWAAWAFGSGSRRVVLVEEWMLGYLQQRNANVNLHFEFSCSVMQMRSNRVTQMQMHFIFQERGYVNMHILSPHIYSLGPTCHWKKIHILLKTQIFTWFTHTLFNMHLSFCLSRNTYLCWR